MQSSFDGDDMILLIWVDHLQLLLSVTPNCLWQSVGINIGILEEMLLGSQGTVNQTTACQLT